MYHIHHHVNSHGTEYMEGTDLHRQHRSCLLGIPVQLGGMYGISSVLWVGTEVCMRGWWSEATGVGRVWKRCGPEGWGLRAWSRVVGSRRGEAPLRGDWHWLAGSEEFGVWHTQEKRCLGRQWALTLRRQGCAAGQALGTPACGWLQEPWALKLCSEWGVFVQASVEITTKVKGAWGERCMPWLKVLDFILWKPVSGGQKREWCMFCGSWWVRQEREYGECVWISVVAVIWFLFFKDESSSGGLEWRKIPVDRWF